MPGFGFNEEGRITFKNLDHDEHKHQRSKFGKSEDGIGEPLEKGWTKEDIWRELQSIGFDKPVKDIGGHHTQTHPETQQKITFSRGLTGDIDWQTISHHYLDPIGFKLSRSPKKGTPGIVFNAKSPHAAKWLKTKEYDNFVRMGMAPPRPPESAPPPMKTWDTTDHETHIPIANVSPGNIITDSAALSAATSKMKEGKTFNLFPPVTVLEIEPGSGKFESLDNDHLVQAAKDAGMSHIPVKIEKLTSPTPKGPDTPEI
jgi:hypothetical protein